MLGRTVAKINNKSRQTKIFCLKRVKDYVSDFFKYICSALYTFYVHDNL